jgi:hypothetical protein
MTGRISRPAGCDLARSHQAPDTKEMAHGKKPLEVFMSCADVTLLFLFVVAAAGLVPVQMKELHGVPGQHGLFLVFRHSGKLLFHQLS